MKCQVLNDELDPCPFEGVMEVFYYGSEDHYYFTECVAVRIVACAAHAEEIMAENEKEVIEE